MRTIVITGANTGIGAACALQLAEPGVHLVLACRSEDKTLPVLEAVRAKGAKASFLALDLADLEQTRAAARAFAAEHPKLDLLINNAGVGGQRGLTKNGFELQFGVNHLGHFAFTLPLLPALEAARGRIVNVSSGNHFKASAIPWARLTEATQSYTGLPEYGVSKLCNVLFTRELRRRYPRITSVSMNPGRIASDIWRRMPAPIYAIFRLVLPLQSVTVGGERLVDSAKVALDGDDAPLYFHKSDPLAANPLALREDLATELWEYSARAIQGATLRAVA
ncbi:MAG: putative oxidoreductase/Short-chain dehydrogenase [Myxococcaceae bacterium]|nr:putative oxidoreductase/Short-chain dehydrogenase [Myxococcaceae bacterium]